MLLAQISDTHLVAAGPRRAARLAALEQALAAYPETYERENNRTLAAKLGLKAFDEGLADGAFDVLALTETDMTIFYRQLATVPAADATSLAEPLAAIRAVGREGAGNAAAAAAWRAIVAGDAGRIPAVLAAMDGANPLAANWLSAAVDALATGHGPVPVDGLRDWYRFRDFPHFVQVYVAVSRTIKTADDIELITRQ